MRRLSGRKVDALLRVIDGVSVAALVAGSLTLAHVLLDGLGGVLEVVNLHRRRRFSSWKRGGEEEQKRTYRLLEVTEESVGAGTGKVLTDDDTEKLELLQSRR